MLARLRSFLAAWTRRARFEDALGEEVRFHLEACTEELVRAGVPRREAERRARVQFGSIQSAKDDCRGARGLRLADELERTFSSSRVLVGRFDVAPVPDNPAQFQERGGGGRHPRVDPSQAEVQQ